MQQNLFPSDPPATSTQEGLFAEVVLDRPLDHPFTYSVGEELRETIGLGKRVRVPFGRGDRSTIGYVVRITEVAPDREVKPVREVLDDEALLTEDLMRLTRWMADYYMCGWGQVLNAVIPAGARDQAGTRKQMQLEPVLENEVPDPAPELTPKQQAAFDELRAARKPLSVKQLSRLAKCGSGPIEALVTKGVARRVERRIEQFADSSPDGEQPATSILLNPDQQKVWDTLSPAITSGGFHAFLLHGVTGSGKTEIYLRAIEEVIRQGKEAIVLVPEISLTPQTIQRFKGRCGEVAVLHSHLGNAERGGHWRRVAKGMVQVVVGARSAIFAPAKKLGLVVIDEEHETTFKQESTPRYHARDVAVMRARLEDVPILLGSATPSLESWYNAERKQYTLLSLPQRVLDLPMPNVAIIDRRHQNPPRGRFPALSDPLEHAMRNSLKAGGQVILLLNRRGFSTHIHCPVCGHVESCKFCDLSLTYHKERDINLCHFCGFEQEPEQNCAHCGNSAIRYQGLGTESTLR